MEFPSNTQEAEILFNSWDITEALACPDKTTFFSENGMRLLNGFWFQVGSDFGLRIGFSLTQELNEIDKSQFICRLNLSHLTVRCLQPKVNLIVTRH